MYECVNDKNKIQINYYDIQHLLNKLLTADLQNYFLRLLQITINFEILSAAGNILILQMTIFFL